MCPLILEDCFLLLQSSLNGVINCLMAQQRKLCGTWPRCFLFCQEHSNASLLYLPFFFPPTSPPEKVIFIGAILLTCLILLCPVIEGKHTLRSVQQNKWSRTQKRRAAQSPEDRLLLREDCFTVISLFKHMYLSVLCNRDHCSLN